MTHIPIPQRTGNKILGDFYPLQKEELIALKRAKVINNVAFVHFALRYENPFCDRPMTIIVKEFAMRWSIPEKSVYGSLSKLKELGIIKFNSGKVTIEWDFSDPRTDSQSEEKILRLEKKFSDPRKNSQPEENQPLEPLPDKDSETSQTIQTFQTPQTEGEEDQNEVRSQKSEVKSENFSQISEILNQETDNCQLLTVNCKEVSAQIKEKVVQEIIQTLTPSKERDEKITPRIIAKLETFNIPLDRAIKKAIANHHPSQVWGAIRHIEKTWETIENPRAIFLYQVPKQPIEERLKDPLTPEFLEWYNEAITRGLVKNISPETLPINQFREPKVFLPDDRLEDWRKVAAGECEELANQSQMADFFKKVAQLRGTKHPSEDSNQEGLRNAAVKI